MAATTSESAAEELTAKSAHKRYEGLMMVRGKAIKGKGAWYWAHLEPLLLRNTETGLPKAVKLRCSLCDAVFSASNPSRTASEHLKRGTCPNFNTFSSVSPRKRTSFAATTSFQALPLAVVKHPPPPPPPVLSGGKDDLGALAMLEDSVKKLKSPKIASVRPILTKAQIETAVDHLADWVYESCGSISFSSLDHPKFRSFLAQVGLPAISRGEFAGARLDARFKEVKAESEARIRDAMFFQVASDGWKWKPKSRHYNCGDENVVNLSVNLPNGTSLYTKALFLSASSSVPSKYAEDVLWDTITTICGGGGSVPPHQCVGIVSDKFKSKALKNLESQNHWMVNLACQHQAFITLIKDFNEELGLFKNVVENCVKLVNFITHKSPIRNTFHKYQLQEYGHTWLLRVLPPSTQRESIKGLDFEGLVCAMVEDVLRSSRALELTLLDESFKSASLEDPAAAREIERMVRGGGGDTGFWNDLEATHSLVNIVKGMAHEIESERPLVGQCLPLWDELRKKVRDWCSKFRIPEEESVQKVIQTRFEKNYHPAWAAAYVLDPLYLLRDTSGKKYLPPFKSLSQEQEKDVNRLITRLVGGDEAHVALMELMKWRTDGLDPVYARAVQMKERDAVTGKMRVANPQSSRLVWETHLNEFKWLGKIAVRLIFLHATSCGLFKWNNNWSLLRWVCGDGYGGHSRIALERAEKIMYIAAHSKLERRDFSSEEEKEAESSDIDIVAALVSENLA
ncbi:uncharacterized protein G2W53_036915 [Senna tora]|uniref:DUF7963 domain-containing protein n=1 Tax=Senna tora TaxID=362788 RepID=A0A834W5J8_9FABA|nr:uncharacterized protein G2W53_036915 [Senna tora]